MSIVDEAMQQVEQPMTHLLVDMINIPNPVGSERVLAEYLQTRFHAAGLATRMQEFEPGRFNVYGLLEGTGNGATLMYAGHLDSAYGGDEEGIRDLGQAINQKHG